MIATINPFTQKKIKQYAFVNNHELQQQLDKVHQSYLSWQNISIGQRAKNGQQLKKLLQNKKDALGHLISTEMGKPLKEALSEIDKCIELVTYFKSYTKSLIGDTHLNKQTYISYHATGAVLGIMPWNFPFWQVFRFAFPNILAGNVCVLKHAPNVTGCALAIENLFLEAGFPKHVFTNLMIDIPQVETVIAHHAIQGVCVTGSTKAGSAVASLAGKYLKKSVLELGGSDAFVILNDADINKALTTAFTARMLNAGQVCISPKRIFVPKQQLSDAIAFLSKKTKGLTFGNPLDTTTNIGPIAKAEFLPVLQKQVTQCIQNGAKLMIGGNVKTPFFEPTLLVVNPDNSLLKQEVFGPVICLIPYEDEETLVHEINNTDYGLGASVWSQDLERAKRIAAKIEVGYVSINQKVSSNPQFAFGGVKKSGYGKELGEQGIKTFLNAKTVTIA